MIFSNSDTALYTLAFLVPGFIWQWVFSALVIQRKEDAQTLLIRFLAMSSVNYALWSWLIYIISRPGFSVKYPLQSAFYSLGIIFVSPTLLGFLTGLFSRKGAVRHILVKCGFKPGHATPVSWDYKFGSVNPGWIIVTLTDGSQVAGYFGESSFASSEFGDRDLYIQEVWEIQETGIWKKIERSDGILLCSNQIKYIEFIRSEEKKNV